MRKTQPSFQSIRQHTLQLLAKHGQEDSEVDGTAGLLHHGLQLLILHVQLAHGGQHVPEVVLANDAISVLVNDCESLPGGGKTCDLIKIYILHFSRWVKGLGNSVSPCYKTCVKVFVVICHCEHTKAVLSNS